MSKKRTKYTSAFKTKLVLELLQNESTIVRPLNLKNFFKKNLKPNFSHIFLIKPHYPPIFFHISPIKPRYLPIFCQFSLKSTKNKQYPSPKNHTLHLKSPFF
ncbi:hypothetical protein [uncultured Gammaproteobacteria bacterium]|nr:hypothetical protein [uncultured Gammaproteobacteria bacterium]